MYVDMYCAAMDCDGVEEYIHPKTTDIVRQWIVTVLRNATDDDDFRHKLRSGK